MTVTPSLVGAIDGENLAFAVARADPELRLDAVRHYKTREFPTFTDAVQSYTHEQRLQTSGLQLGLAVAGVAKGDVISQVNCPWYISVSGLTSHLGVAPLIINDFAAIAWSLSSVTTARMRTIGAAVPKAVAPGCTFLALGTGAGLGAATLVVDEAGSTTVMSSEAGHSSFSPQSAREDALLGALRGKYGHVSFERLLAASGLLYIYGWLAESDGQKADPLLAAEDIVSAAVGRRHPRAVEAVDLFVEILGSFVGNSVLTAGAFDGAFLVGPLLGSMLPVLQSPRFRAAFIGKGRMKKMLNPVPTSFVDDDDARLHGVATALRNRRAGRLTPLAA
jgi:glucokinase